jgi:hypothetical protein
MSSAYRSAYDHIVGLKRDEVREARELIAPQLPGLRDIVQARISRVIGGIAGIGAAAAMCWYAATTPARDEAATYALLFGMIGLGMSWAISRGLLAVRGKFQRLRAEPELTGQLERDLALLDESDLRNEVRALEQRADKLETASIALPFAGLTVLTPLFLPWLFAAIFLSESTRDYSEWIRISLVIVGHAHVALAVLGYLFARKLHRSTIEAIAGVRIHREWAKIWLITIGVSCLPGIVLILVPPILVALTGLAFIPLMVLGLHHAVLQERTKLAAVVPERLRIEGLDLPAALADMPPSAKEEERSAEKKQREADRDDEHAEADAGDRAQA